MGRDDMRAGEGDRQVVAPVGVTSRQMASWVRPYAGVVLLCVAIWAITSSAAGHPVYFWPVWMIIPLIVGVAGQWLSHRHGR